MGRNFSRFMVLIVAMGPSSNLTAMNSGNRCTVVASEKLPISTGGPQQICETIGRLIGAATPHAAYRIEVKVLSPTRLSATLVVNGRTLPEQKFAIMDRELNRAAIERFAQSLATAVANAAKS